MNSGQITTAPLPAKAEAGQIPIMYDELCSWDNLLAAYHQAAKGKRGRHEVAAFEHQLEDNLLSLQEDLLAQTYVTGGYQSFYIREPKRRLISAAPFRDRVVHHALCNLIEPIFERSFIFDSYANRVGKGTHRALDRCQQFARKYAYVLQCDVKQFFPSVDHEILKSTLKAKISDEKVNWLISRILRGGAGVLSEEYDMQWFDKDDLFAIARPRGLPIGNLTSQFWANCYLNSFDHFVKRELRCEAYIRYVDDFVLFDNDKKLLQNWLERIQNRLEIYRLVLHSGACPKPATEPISFLGFVIFRNKRRLRRERGVRFMRKLKNLVCSYKSQAVLFDSLDNSVRGWVNHVRYANTIGLRKSVLSKVRI